MTNRSKVGLDSYTAGNDFQDDIAMSWSFCTNSWRMRIRDGGHGDRPADEIVVLDKFRVLAELKRTQSNTFKLKALVKTNQINGLLAFDKLNYYNVGVLIIHFSSIDECYVVRIAELLKYIVKIRKFSISHTCFSDKQFPVLRLHKKDGVWDLTNFDRTAGELYGHNSK